MKNSKKVNCVMETRIEIAAALSLKNQAAAVFDAGGTKQSFWFLESPEFRKAYKELEEENWQLDAVAHVKEIVKLYDFVVDSIRNNADYDAEQSKKVS